MTIKLDHALLVELGLGGLPASEANLLLRTIYDTLQIRVGVVLTKRMSAADLDRFNRANALGDAESLRVLTEIAPNYSEVVAAEFERLKDEVALAVPTIRQATLDRAADHAPWRHHRPDPGPTAVLALDDWLIVVSPYATVCLALGPGGTALYARRHDLPPVVLELPDGCAIDGSSLWCDDRGEVRARFAAHSDLRWRLADVPTSATLGYDKVLHRRRPSLSVVDYRVHEDELIEFAHGRWHIEDGYEMTVTDRAHHRSFRLQPLRGARHWNAVVPHFTPDLSQLVAAYNTNRPPAVAGLQACSVGYLDAAALASANRKELMPWEHRCHPTATEERLAAGDRIRLIEAVGYDASSTRAVVADEAEVHLFNVRNWERLRDLVRPDQRARVVSVSVPGSPLAVAWAARALVVATTDRRLWRLDLRVGSSELRPLADLPAPMVALVSWGDRAAALCANRAVVGVDEDGQASVTHLPGDEPLTNAAVLADGRLIAVTAVGVELFAGTRLVDAEPTDTPVAGVAPCARDAGWAIAWHADRSVSTLRCRARALHLDPGTLPRHPSDAPPLRAIGGEMSDVGRWHLLVPEEDDDQVGETTTTHIYSPLGRVDISAHRAASLAPAGLAVFATENGLEFLPALRPKSSYPFPIPLPTTPRGIASGRCATSLAVIGDEGLWLIRLLR